MLKRSITYLMKDRIQRWLSYILDIQIDYRYSDINDDLIVLLSKGRYQLCSANAIYSYEDKYANFSNVFRDHMDFRIWKGTDVLLLGLGLGSIPITLDQIEKKRWSFVAVEIDPAVCELASLYGYPKIFSPIQTVVGDAVSFVSSHEDQYDMICIDLFIDDVMPSTSKSVEFLTDVKQLLTSEGIVIANTLAFTEEHKKQSRLFFEQVFQKVFPKGQIIETHVNYMLINDPKYFASKRTR